MPDPIQVPEEALEAAAKARHEAERRRCKTVLRWEEMSKEYRQRRMQRLRSPLAAALPAIEEKVREEERAKRNALEEERDRHFTQLAEADVQQVGHKEALVIVGNQQEKIERLQAERDQAAQELTRYSKFRGAVDFEVGCMEDYAAEKGGMLGKLAGEMAEPLRAALDAVTEEVTDGG